MEFNNKYYILRHGEAVSNVKEIISSWPEKFNNHLTKKGRAQIKKAAKELKNKNIDIIFASDLLRAKETAEIVGKELKIKSKFDKRLRELSFGIFDNKPIVEFVNFFKNKKEKIKKAPLKGESYNDVSKRVFKFLKEIDKKYKEKNILIVSHQCPLFLLEGYVKDFSISETIVNYPEEKMLQTGEIRELN